MTECRQILEMVIFRGSLKALILEWLFYGVYPGIFFKEQPMIVFSRFQTGFFLIALFASLPFWGANPAVARSGQSTAPVKLTASSGPERAEARVPRLHVTGAEKPVRLISLAIHTEIRGGFAESSLDMKFQNPNGRILEGELEFPLGPGQEISGLALDINGELRRGVPVAKARGQEVFDEVARRKVDPALLEATRGNAYKLRVYPLPAGGTRRVVVRLMQPLTIENGTLHYRLPLSFAEQLDSISIEAEVAAPEGRVKAEAGNLDLRLEPAGTVYRGRVEHKNITPEGWLDITLPAPDSLAASVTAARWRDKLYFSAAAHLAGPDKARTLPDLVTVLWDASGSGRDRNLADEFALLDRYFKTFGSGRAKLVVLRDKADPPQTFTIKNGDWQELREAVHGLVYDGATNLTDWTPAADCREFLLFSDGLANYRGAADKGKFPEMAAEQRLFAVNSAPTADYAALRALAVRGAVIDLAHDPLQLAEAKLLRESAEVRVVNSTMGGAAEAVLEPESTRLSSADGRGGLIRLAGWAKRGGGVKEVPVRVMFPDGQSRELVIALPGWDESPEFTGEDVPLQARLWGRYAIAGLEADYRTNKKAIARLGEQFGIVSRETSLIVLETAEDYARYDVTPPASLQARVETLRRNKAAGGERTLSEGQLLSLWRAKVKWWETDFGPKPKTEKPKPVEETENSGPEVAETAAPPDSSKINRDQLPRTAWYKSDKTYAGQKISLDYKDEDIHRVIREIAADSGKSVVISDAVRGQVTLKLRDVPWDQALDIVLASRNLGVEESGDVLTVYDLPTLNSIRAGQSRLAAERSTEPAPASGSGSVPASPPAAESALAPNADRLAEAIPQPSSGDLAVGVINEKDARELKAQLNSWETSAKVRTISAPRIMAANDQEVTIKQGQQIPYNSGSSATTAANVTFRDSGDSLSGFAGSRSRSGSGAGESGRSSEVKGGGLYLKPWVSDAPYIARMKEAKDDELYAVYLDERPAYLDSSAFFFDMADRFFERGLKELGLRVLSNLAEMKLENRQILRMLAYRLMQAGEMAAALPVLEQVRDLAPYEPQSLRDIATVKAALGRPQEAVELLYETARRQWSDRFGDINTIALTEMNALIAAHGDELRTGYIDSRLIKNLASDIRVVLSWDMDNTDMDLWVIAPDGEAANYSHRETRIGGRMTTDCTRGYGPEEFMLKKAIPGVYRVEVNYYGHSRQTIAGEVTMIVTVFSKFGTSEQKEEQTTLRLKKTKEKVLVAEFTVEE